MSFLGSDHERTGGGMSRFRQIVGRIFGDAENPLGWALTVGRVSGITVRLHLFFLIYVIAQLLWSIPSSHGGIGYMALAMSGLFFIVLLHEFGHCFACRKVGGEADDILMWPLGGLASCAPPHNWRAHFVTAAGGPMVNVVIFPLTGGALLLAGKADAIFFNPFDPLIAVGTLDSWWVVGLWWAHYLNLLILAFNVLLPMFPMDGGRLMHALLWRRSSYRQATETTVLVGLVTAGVVGVVAIVSEETLLLAIAIFGGLMCWRERQVIRADADLTYAPEAGTISGAGFGHVAMEEESPAERKRRERMQKERAKAAKEQAEEDRILAKIAAHGMQSLTRVEKRTLKKATERRRGG